MKTALCTLTILVASLAASLAIAEQAPPAPRYSAADEAVYMQRFGKLQEAFRLGLGLESYEPLEPVPGAPGARLLPTAEAGQVHPHPLASGPSPCQIGAGRLAVDVPLANRVRTGR